MSSRRKGGNENAVQNILTRNWVSLVHLGCEIYESIAEKSLREVWNENFAQ